MDYMMGQFNCPSNADFIGVKDNFEVDTPGKVVHNE